MALKSIIFHAKTRAIIENNVCQALNATQLMSASTLHSPRAVGDAVQSFLEENIAHCIPDGMTININASFARRAMADMAFEDVDVRYYVVDVKTHNMGTKFNMPNLTSVERLARFYDDRNNYFTLLLISYQIEENTLHFKKCLFVPIEMLDWSCLTLGALGWGQIQIANSNIVSINENITRKQWMLQLCDALDAFYPNEIAKISSRIEHFKKIRNYWQCQMDD
jgi:hypothetical protein